MLSDGCHNGTSKAPGLTLIELYLITAVAALGAYLLTRRLRPRDRVATVVLVALLALTLTAVLARTIGERGPIHAVEHLL